MSDIPERPATILATIHESTRSIIERVYLAFAMDDWISKFAIDKNKQIATLEAQLREREQDDEAENNAREHILAACRQALGTMAVHGYIEGVDRIVAKLREREQEIERLKRDGWYLVSADRPVEWLGGSCFQRNGEPNSSANCASWYGSAVYWRNQAEKAKAQVAALGKPVTFDELARPYSGAGLVGLANCINAIIRSRITKP